MVTKVALVQVTGTALIVREAESLLTTLINEPETFPLFFLKDELVNQPNFVPVFKFLVEAKEAGLEVVESFLLGFFS